MIEADKPQLIIHNEYSVFRIGLFLFIFIGIGAGVIGVKLMRDTRSKASQLVSSPSPFVDVHPSPATDLTAPYIRLVTAKKKYGISDTIPVDVYLQTKGNQTVETDLLLTYDPKLLAIDETSVQSSDVFKTMSFEQQAKGQINLTLFNTSQAGHPAVVADTEVKIATLNFKAQATPDKEVKIAIDFKKGDTKKTLLVPYSVSRPEFVESILESVEGVSFEIGT